MRPRGLAYACEDAHAVRKYIEELTFVRNDLKLAVIRRTARGSFRREFEDYLAERAVATLTAPGLG